jgi:hypothetical protein
MRLREIQMPGPPGLPPASPPISPKPEEEYERDWDIALERKAEVNREGEGSGGRVEFVVFITGGGVGTGGSGVLTM